MMKNDNKGVETQYRTAEKFNVRISIHEKYSINSQPFGEWIVSQYEIRLGSRILELGCGTGSMWRGKLSLLDGGAYLTLTDFSSGMLEEARNNVGESPNVDFCQVDIQNIPLCS